MNNVDTRENQLKADKVKIISSQEKTVGAFRFGLTVKIALLVAILVVLTTVAVSSWIFKSFDDELIRNKVSELSNETYLQGERFKSQTKKLLEDVTFLAETPPIQGIIRAQAANGVDPDDGSTTEMWKRRLETIFINMLRVKPEYVQIRFIGIANNGLELIRVEHSGTEDSIRVVPEDGLQSKGDTRYFKNAIESAAGQTTLSNIELNREYGEIALPHVPIIRASIPVYDNQNNIFGIVVLNKDIRSNFKSIVTTSDKYTHYIVNSKGEYLFHPDAAKTFQFEYGESVLIQDDYPEFALAFSRDTEADEVLINESENGTKEVVNLRKINYSPAGDIKILGIAVRDNFEHVLAESKNVRNQAYEILAIFVLLAVIIGILYAQKLSRPILEITRAVKEFSHGNANIFLPVQASGEAGILAKAFSELIDNVKDREKSLKIEVEERDRAEQQIKAVLDNAVDAIITIDTSGSILTANNSAVDIFGYTKDEMLGQNVKMLMPDPYRKEHDGYLDNYFRTGEKKVIGIGREVTGLRKDGSTFPMELSVSEVLVGDKRSFTGIVKDISERKIAEELIKEKTQHLEETTNYLSGILENAVDAIISIEANGKIRAFNPAAERMFGYQTEEVFGKNIKMLMPQPYEKEHDGYLKHYLETGEKKVIGIGRDVTGLRKDGSTFPMELSVSEVLVGDKRSFTGIVRDISERKRAEDELSYQKNYYEALIQNLNVPAFVLNNEHKVVIWNKACEQLTGISAEDVLGTSEHWRGFYNENRPLLADIVLDGVFESIKNYYEVELQESLISGAHHLESWCAMPLKHGPLYLTIDAGAILDDDGEVIAVVEVLKDITSLKQAQEKLETHQEELERSNQELERFAYVASHDLQEPLRMVSSYTQLLAKRYKDKLDQDANDYINFAVDGAVRMQSLIQDLLKYSRLSSESIEFTEVDTNGMFDYAVRNLAVVIDETGTVVTKDDLPIVLGDEGQLRQLFQNLIGNAIKYHDPEKLNKVHVSVKDIEGGFQFCVEDNGIGIAPEYYEKIFVIFKRLHGTSEYKGTGIGLALCKRIVESHNGKIWVESEFGKGSKFYFKLLNTKA